MSRLRSFSCPLPAIILFLSSMLLASVSGAVTWDVPFDFGISFGFESHDDESVRILSDGNGTWLAVWQSSDDPRGRLGPDEEILYSRSTDNGQTWSEAVPLNPDAATDGTRYDEGPAGFATDGLGAWIVAWTTYVPATPDLTYDAVYVRSTDNGATWSTPLPLHTGPGSETSVDGLPQIATDGLGVWIAVWETASLGGIEIDLVFARSLDNGANWSDPAPLNSDAASDTADDYLGQIASDGAGNWIVVWARDDFGGTGRDIFYARSGDNGLSWSPLTRLNAPTDSGRDDFPVVAADGAGGWVVVWRSTDSLFGAIGTDRDILVVHSTDGGQSWSIPGPLNSDAGVDFADDSFPDVAVDNTGRWVAVWSSINTLDGTLGPDRDILFSVSLDLGVSWSPPAPVNVNAASDAGSDQLPDIATDNAGDWFVAWESNDELDFRKGADLDVFLARSSNLGSTWSAPSDINLDRTGYVEDAWTPFFGQDQAGNGFLIWCNDDMGNDTDPTVFIFRADSPDLIIRPLNSNASTDIGADRNPWLASDSKGNLVAVWESTDPQGGTIGTDADILVVRSSNSGNTWTAPVPLHNSAFTDTGGDLSPKVVTDGAGRWIAAWESNESFGGLLGEDDDILYSVSSDNGATWSDPLALNLTAGSDSGHDRDVQLNTDRAGTWVAVWTSNESLGKVLGSDWDILYSRSTDNGTSWSPPSPLNLNAATDTGNDWRPQVLTDGSRNWMVVWESQDSLGDTIGVDCDILFSVSRDRGNTWSVPAPLNTNATSDTGEDFSPRLAADRYGTWMAVWHSTENLNGSIGLDRDIFYSYSTDRGSTWTPPAFLNSDAEVDSSPDFDPNVAADNAGNWNVAWESLSVSSPHLKVSSTKFTGTLNGSISDAVTGLAVGCVAVVAASADLYGERVSAATANGEYQLPQLPSGNYTLEVFAPGYERFSTALVIGTGGNPPLDILLNPGGGGGSGVFGIVTDEITGSPMGGVRVDAVVDNVVVATTYTCGEGRYEFQDLLLKAGGVTLNFSAFNYEPKSIPVELEPGETKQVDAELKPKVQIFRTLAGTVRDNDACDVPCTPECAVLPETRITATTPSDPTGQTTYADINGNYVLQLEPGFWHVSASNPGYTGHETDAVILSEIDPPARDFCLDPEARILMLETMRLEVDSGPGPRTVAVQNGGGGRLIWNAVLEPGSEWLSVERSGTALAWDLVVNYGPNPTPEPRTGTITVIAEGAEGSPAQILVTQAANPYPIVHVEPQTLRQNRGGGQRTITVENRGVSPLEWSAQVASGADWLSLTTAKLGSGGTITLQFGPNSNQYPRAATVVVSSNDPYWSEVSIAASQDGARDVDGNSEINAVDVQLVINEALGLSTGHDGDLDVNGRIDAVDVQLIVNAALGLF